MVKQCSKLNAEHSSYYYFSNYVMEKRAYQRIPVNLYARLIYGNMIFLGAIMNISKNGMCIKTIKRFPVESKFEILIPLITMVLKIKVKVIRFIKTNDVYYGMGVEVLKRPGNYLELVDGFE